VTAAELFGVSVKLSEDGVTMAIGARDASVDELASAGLVRVFSFNGTAWVQVGRDLKGARANEWFGHSVDLSSNGRVLIGRGFGAGIPNAIARVYSLESSGR